MSDIPYSSITVSGPDSFDFLQAQLTTEIAAIPEAESNPVRTGRSGQANPVAESKAIRSAWCNPKGRVICMPFLSKNADSYCLTIPTELVELVTQRMTMFRFRSKVEFAAQTASPEELGIETTVDDWLLKNLRDGVPEIWLPESERFTPHMLNLDLLDAINFDKGCYTGQEIVARTHYKGATKRRTLRFESETPVSVGDKVTANDRDVGEVLNVAGNDLLAVVPVDKIDESLSVGDAKLANVALPYLDTTQV